MWGNDTDNIIKEFFESSDDNYQKQEQIMRLGSGFNFDSLELMDYKLHKVSLKRGGSYIKSPEWLMHKRATINPKNKKVDKCFQKAWEVFKIKNLGEYHDLYVQCDTLLLADVFENFRNVCIKIHELDTVHFLSAPGLTWQACLKRQKKI